MPSTPQLEEEAQRGPSRLPGAVQPIRAEAAEKDEGVALSFYKAPLVFVGRISGSGPE